ncbi:BatD family protein [Puia dinghuensis]|uniref:Uncharacterized protein n=1 Tax=Puia dinghuensis TaxID=1792502 RepID=A0A8J2UDR7_9BACT|nr:BatD family protein [Puia dinghuensis]GGB03703.1 hypothetical protein GCM10011511_28750 [Puia dinghuensis]
MRWRNLILYIFLAGAVRPLNTFAQHTFDDLPVHDPSVVSVLDPNENAGKKIKDNIFILATINRSYCYPGEQLLLTYRLYTALQSTSTIAAKPSLVGFTAKESGQKEEPLPEKEISRKLYDGFTIWQVLVTPLQPGDDTIGPLLVNNDVKYLDATGRPGHYSGVVGSNKVIIHVRPLPPAGRPSDFTGAVGQWHIHTFLSTHWLAAGEIDTLLMEIEGSGSFGNLTLPPIRWPAGFRHFEPVERWQLRENTFPQSGKKIVAIPFTASHPGQYVFPTIAFTWFDPAAGKYDIAHTDSLPLQVIGSTAKTTAHHSSTPPTSWWPQAILIFLLAAILTLVLILQTTAHKNP